MNNRIILNIKYSFLQGTYWMFYGAIYSFASAYLLDKGIKNSQIGIILALSNIIGIMFISIFSEIADRGGFKASIRIGKGLSLCMLSLIILLNKGNIGAFTIAVLFVCIISMHTCLQPIINDLAFKLSATGNSVSFGFARSMGSLAYSALCAILGIFVNNYGALAIPRTGMIILFSMLVCFMLFDMNIKKLQGDKNECLLEGNSSKNIDKSQNMLTFLSHNLQFAVLCLGVIGVFFSNGILNSFLLQIVEEVNGTKKDLGYLYAFMAVLEVPTLIFFDKINKHLSYKFMLSLASICFTVKIALCTIATNVTFLYIATLLQPLGFALFLPAMVHYIETVMSKTNAVKGQGSFTMAVTISSLLASIVGGFIIDIFSVHTMNVLATLSGVLGSIIVFFSIRNPYRKKHE